MPTYGTKRQRAERYAALVERDKEVCKRCGHTPTVEHPVIIDHLDNSAQHHRRDKRIKINWALSNLRLLCIPCNRTKVLWEVSTLPTPDLASNGYTPPYMQPTKGNNGYSPQLQSILNRVELSAVMEKNIRAEKAFREWILAYVEMKEVIGVVDAINAGAEAADCSIQAVKSNYLVKITSLSGPLQIRLDDAGEAVIVRRAPEQRMMKPFWNGHLEEG